VQTRVGGGGGLTCTGAGLLLSKFVDEDGDADSVRGLGGNEEVVMVVDDEADEDERGHARDHGEEGVLGRRSSRAWRGAVATGYAGQKRGRRRPNLDRLEGRLEAGCEASIGGGEWHLDLFWISAARGRGEGRRQGRVVELLGFG
jgi:hypothetical protein